jgi:hypothetical protein
VLIAGGGLGWVVPPSPRAGAAFWSFCWNHLCSFETFSFQPQKKEDPPSRHVCPEINDCQLELEERQFLAT